MQLDPIPFDDEDDYDLYWEALLIAAEEGELKTCRM